MQCIGIFCISIYAWAYAYRDRLFVNEVYEEEVGDFSFVVKWHHFFALVRCVEQRSGRGFIEVAVVEY